MNLSKGFANIALVLLVVALVGAVGYLTLVKAPTPSIEVPSPTKTPTSTPTPAPTPTKTLTSTPTPTPAPTPVTASNKCIKIDNLAQGDKVSFPLTITGILNPNAPTVSIVDCIRIFEAEAGFVSVKDQNGNNLLVNVAAVDLIIKATGNWMVNGPVPFVVNIPALTTQPYTNDINIIFAGGNNPQDNAPLPSPDAIFVLNVTL